MSNTLKSPGHWAATVEEREGRLEGGGGGVVRVVGGRWLGGWYVWWVVAGWEGQGQGCSQFLHVGVSPQG